MIRIGQRVVHSGLGIGEVLGRVTRSDKEFWQIRFDKGLICLIGSLDDKRLRPLASRHEAEAVLEHVQEFRPTPSTSYATRARRYRSKLESGDLCLLGEVVKSLNFLARRRPLGDTESRLLQDSRQRLVRELALATGRDPRYVTRWLTRACG